MQYLQPHIQITRLQQKLNKKVAASDSPANSTTGSTMEATTKVVELVWKGWADVLPAKGEISGTHCVS